MAMASAAGPWRFPAAALLVIAAALLVGGLPRPAALHLAFIGAALPLIFAAMLHFVPVLTRSGHPAAPLRRLPLAFFPVAALLLGHLAAGWPTRSAAAAGALAAAALLLGWTVRRGRQAFGAPHPGLWWYAAALAALLLALAALLAAPLWPEQWGALRRLHLHLNLLGFIGMTAVGTLWVLLPTAGGYADPGAAPRLRRDLPWAAAGTLAVALGAAWLPPLAWLGWAAWLYVAARLLLPLLRQFRPLVWRTRGVASALGVAVAGLLLNLAAVPLHGRLGAAGVSALFVAGFLLPLVTAAAAQLVPVWRWPAEPERQRRGREAMAWAVWPRALLSLAAAAGWGAGWNGGQTVAAALALGAALLLAAGLRAGSR